MNYLRPRIKLTRELMRIIKEGLRIDDVKQVLSLLCNNYERKNNVLNLKSKYSTNSDIYY